MRAGIERAEGGPKQVARKLRAVRREPFPSLREHPFSSGGRDALVPHRSELKAQSVELTSFELGPAFPFSIQTRPRDARAGKLRTQSSRAMSSQLAPASLPSPASRCEMRLSTTSAEERRVQLTARTVQKSAARSVFVKYAYGIVPYPFLPQSGPHELRTMISFFGLS